MSSQVRVGLSDRAYDILIARSLADGLAAALQACGDVTHAVIVTDQAVESLHAEPLRQLTAQHVQRCQLISIPSGETSKSLQHFQRLCEQLLETGADRKSLIVACGGGVVGDLAGFVAASFARGVRFLQVPTTLLAQVDSSVGGKVGVNLPQAKNMVGAFWQPSAVLIATDTLQTLPDRDFRSGLAEVVKYGVILDESFFEYLEQHVEEIHHRESDVLETIVARSCRFKADVVENDEREESGLRAMLNYGHTFAHAIEAETAYGAYLHGEAVAVGMLCASTLAERLGRVSSELVERQRRLLEQFKLPVRFGGASIDSLMNAMMRDKKVEHGRLRFILPARMGKVELVGDVPEEHVRAAWAAWRDEEAWQPKA